jgi:predicted nucleotidyltransferase component of viral defense system
MATLIQTLERVLASSDPLLLNETRRILLKSALQAQVLDFLYNHRQYRRLNFYGGTCLHVIYGLNRLSEDIDLDNSRDVTITALDEHLLNHFHQRLGYREATVKQQESDAGILRITLKFPVLYDLGLTPHQDEQLHLKVEISQHPQIAQLRQTPVMFMGRSFVPSHFSLETMMAGKILACLERSFIKGATTTMVKGRDFYDLLWFMQQRVQPLEEKLTKEGWRPYTIRTAMLELTEKVSTITPRDLSLDLLPLFERRAFIQAWVEAFHDNFSELVRHYLG